MQHLQKTGGWGVLWLTRFPMRKIIPTSIAKVEDCDRVGKDLSSPQCEERPPGNKCPPWPSYPLSGRGAMAGNFQQDLRGGLPMLSALAPSHCLRTSRRCAALGLEAVGPPVNPGPGCRAKGGGFFCGGAQCHAATRSRPF